MVAMVFILLLVLSTVCVSGGHSWTWVMQCPSVVQRDKYLQVYGSKCYQFHIYERKTFQEAQSQCQRGGGNLAMVTSQNINDFISNQLNNFYNRPDTPVWFGLRSGRIYGYLPDYYIPFWVNGSRINGYSNFYQASAYNSAGCMAIMPRYGRWFQYPCEGSYLSYKTAFVCEYLLEKKRKSTSTTTNTKTFLPKSKSTTKKKSKITTWKLQCPSNLPSDNRLKIFGKKCYRFELDARMTFQDARGQCQERGGTLALAKTKAVNDFLLTHLRNTFHLGSSPVWIGLRTYLTTGRNYQYYQPFWVDGTQMSYTYNNFFSPNQYNSDSCAAFLPSKGFWYLYSCDKYYSPGKTSYFAFVCEFPLQNITTTIIREEEDPPTTMKTTPKLTTTPTSPSTFRTSTTTTTTTPKTTSTPTDKIISTTTTRTTKASHKTHSIKAPSKITITYKDNRTITFGRHISVVNIMPPSVQQVDTHNDSTTSSTTRVLLKTTDKQMTKKEPLKPPTTILSQPPTTSTKPPTTSTQPPTTSTKPPTTSTQPPTTSTEPPTTSTKPPTTSTKRTTTSTKSPTISTEPPTSSTKRPTTSTEPPTTSTEPPTTSTEPPTTSTEPPTTSTKPPTTLTELLKTSASTITTISPPTTTVEYKCPFNVCELDCGLDGYVQNSVTKCMECQCNFR